MPSSYLPGKFARVYATGIGNIAGAYRWTPGFRRERLDTTNFESAVSTSGYNVFSEGDTGPLDTTISLELWVSPTNVNYFFPDAPLTVSLFYRKNNPLGYSNLLCDVLDFSPGTSVREVAKGTAQLQTSGIVSSAA